MWRSLVSGLLLAPLYWLPAVPAAAQIQPLPSWNEGAARQRILQFVAAVTTPGGPDYVAPVERIAVFDNDGTLWAEQPMYVQLAFAIDRARTLVSQQPELAAHPVLAAAAAARHGEAMPSMGIPELLELVALTHAGMDAEAFRELVGNWFASACHPTWKRSYRSLTYQPMRELLDYLRSHGFQTYIVSAGGVEFVRVVSEELYGIPPEQVIGSFVASRYALQDGLPTIVRQAEVQLINDGAIKPVMIEQVIGRQPIAAFGNSDGDFEMLEWTTSQPGASLGLIVHHDDPEREVAYDSPSSIGRLDRALKEAPRRGWMVVSMRDDWARVFADHPARPLEAECP
ncbi:HAD family phosphatase [Cyanobium sp. NS01]|uniref:HAD family hydrolase n=1 Tax=Cyanobium sp. NS01 TaxID=261284 RepID=UPI00164852D5|nr:HAD family hydrolase [Cyanobium sp. NS01]QNI70051.1 haloacid dehalogenase-like hydrolase family protein [Cyanobium sp. NS01]